MIGHRIWTRLGLVVATVLAFAGTSVVASAAPKDDAKGSEVTQVKHGKKGKKGKKGKGKHQHHGKKKAPKSAAPKAG